jgi:hypothetical protein
VPPPKSAHTKVSPTFKVSGSMLSSKAPAGKVASGSKVGQMYTYTSFFPQVDRYSNKQCFHNVCIPVCYAQRYGTTAGSRTYFRADTDDSDPSESGYHAIYKVTWRGVYIHRNQQVAKLVSSDLLSVGS